mgnify:FL=1
MIIIIDNKEKMPWKFTGIDCTIIKQHLNAGDYSIQGMEDKIAIERKRSSNELAINILEPRFINALERLSKVEHPFVLCEFPEYYISTLPSNSCIPKFRQKYLRVNAGFLYKKIKELREQFPNIVWVFLDSRTLAEMKAVELFKKYGSS